jgi:hypothetical protein
MTDDLEFLTRFRNSRGTKQRALVAESEHIFGLVEEALALAKDAKAKEDDGRYCLCATNLLRTLVEELVEENKRMEGSNNWKKN